MLIFFWVSANVSINGKDRADIIERIIHGRKYYNVQRSINAKVVTRKNRDQRSIF